jgi:hypothetical protein
MKWANLKSMERPKCGDSLVEVPDGYQCQQRHQVRQGCATALGCQYFITKQRFDEVVSSLYKPHEQSTEFMSDDERLYELNNYGREPRYERGDLE